MTTMSDTDDVKDGAMIPPKPVKPTLPLPIDGTSDAVRYHRAWADYWGAATRRYAWISLRLSVSAVVIGVAAIVVTVVGH